ncbi:MAG: hypothetical protein DHS80DRAFT_22936 [Piptocephalis tieghemiana]|nr:MAG: hypothetical protein DHS80DRAFT_22936 [Piptocephalis tieghemiana]
MYKIGVLYLLLLLLERHILPSWTHPLDRIPPSIYSSLSLLSTPTTSFSETAHEREEWKDIQPIPQNDGSEPLCPIAYSKELAQKREHSKRALDLTSHIITLVPAHYTIWNYRLEIIDHIKANLEEELAWVEEMAIGNPKCYQVWHHRQAILSRMPNPKVTQEFKVLSVALEEDAKNYHAWTYRQWLLRTYGGWEGELEFIEQLLKDDPYNNSAWNQRYLVIHHDPSLVTLDTLKQEVSYTMDRIRLAPDNESAWNYLSGTVRHDLLRLGPLVEEFVLSVKEKGWSHCVSMNVHIVELYEMDPTDETRRQRALQSLDILIKNDAIRIKYWTWIKEHMESN